MTVSLQKEEIWTQRHSHTGRMPCEDEGRELGDASTSQGRPKIAGKPPEVTRKAWTDSSSQPSKGTKPAGPLILDFQPPEL